MLTGQPGVLDVITSDNDNIDGGAGATTTVTIIWNMLEVCTLHYGIACFADDINLRRDDDTRLAAFALPSTTFTMSFATCPLRCCMHSTRALTYIPRRLQYHNSLPQQHRRHASCAFALSTPSPVSCIWSQRTSHGRRLLS